MRSPAVLPYAIGALCASLLAACASTPAVSPGTPCETADFIVDDAFDGARRGACTRLSGHRVRLEIRPEDPSVSNPSPWYAFRIAPRRPGTAEIVLDYGTWKHRYPPKLSGDGETWRSLEPEQIQVTADRTRAVIDVPLADRPVWVSAQELITTGDILDWTRRMSARAGVQRLVLGRSIAGADIEALRSGAENADLLLLVGRQHPPEVSGSVAMAGFVETLLADTALARAFRRRIGIVAIPLLNPDGVDRGHWRHNLGDRDPNRDWGPFAEPETALIRDLLDGLDAEGRRIRLFIDFHSTDRNLFYTQPETDRTEPEGFTQRWFARVRPRLAGYEFSDEPRPQSDTPNSKNFVYRRYGVPAITYEVGDETDRDSVRRASGIFAEELMKLMLETIPVR